MIRFLADENFPARAVGALRQAGVRVDSVLEIAPGTADELVLLRALEAGAVILTFDKDFGELVWRSRPTRGFGVVLFRIRTPKAADAGWRLRASYNPARTGKVISRSSSQGD
jgi:predicted nuclease of predicted toxin-antitoxin system